MSNTLVSVVMVTRGRKDYLRLVLDSVLKQAYPFYEIIVIDNSLEPNFGRVIKENYPQVKFYSSEENLFYCQALNKGIGLSSGEFILCLNDDVVLDKNFLGEALRGFGIDSKIGMVSGKILRADGKTIDSTGLFLSVWRTAKERGHGLPDTGGFEQEEYIFGVNGAVAFYRKKMLDELRINSWFDCVVRQAHHPSVNHPEQSRRAHHKEYFDSDFHIFYEDLDIAWRGQNFGWQAYYIPQAIAYHTRGGTVRADEGIGKRFARYYLDDGLCADLIKNRWLAIIKNETLSGFLNYLPFIILYDCAAGVYLIFFRPQVVKKLIAGISRYLRSALNKRKLLNKYAFLKNS